MTTSLNTLPNNLTLHRYIRSNKSYTEALGNGVELKLMLIPSGEFLMGATEVEADNNDEQPQHLVRITQFLMGRYTITQAQWRVVASYDRIDKELNPDPSKYKRDKRSKFKRDNRPVEQVSWEDAKEFCKRLSVKTGKEYCLPSEAQWEYACRAGTKTPFHLGETITTALANYDGKYTYSEGPKGEYRGETMDVGSFPANDWGLYDMHGNVWEWCEDDWHDSYRDKDKDAPSDGSAWIESDRTETRRLLRGGSWGSNPRYCRSAYRYHNSRDYISDNVGFRVCCVPPSTLCC